MDGLDFTPGPGGRCGFYSLIRRIGAGAMGEVFEAEQTTLKRRVAIKFLGEWAGQHPNLRRLFVQEAELAARMRHPNIIAIHDVGAHHGRPYFVMEYLQGQTLKSLIRREGPLSPKRVVELMKPILCAVASAHERGVIHRDLKPDNIFMASLDSGPTPKVLDFGISRLQETEEREDIPSGTPGYMAPEQVLGQGSSELSDQYSLGAILHELCRGALPGGERDMLQIMGDTIHKPYPIEDLVDVDETLRTVIIRATSREPSARYASLREMSDALEGVVEPCPEQLYPEPRKANRLRLTLSLLLVAASVVAGIWFARMGAPPPPPAHQGLPEQALNDGAEAHPQAQVPQAQVPQAQVPQAQVPQAQVPQAQVPQERVQQGAEASAHPTREARRRSRSAMHRETQAEEAASPSPMNGGASDPWGARPAMPVGSTMSGLDPWAR